MARGYSVHCSFMCKCLRDFLHYSKISGVSIFLYELFVRNYLVSSNHFYFIRVICLHKLCRFIN